MLIDLEDVPGGFVAYPGIGINVNGDPVGANPALEGIATSLRLATGRTIDRERLLAVVCNGLEQALAWTPSRLADEYRARSLVLGRRVSVTSGRETFEGTADAIRDDGSLDLRLDSGDVMTVNAGDVSLRPA
jgi:BirA family biotin operon repressor/biotin-[acetyl-CoA-carboxylase] ligase